MNKKFYLKFTDKEGIQQKGYIEITLETKTKGVCFSASGAFKELHNTKWIDSYGGQCLDKIKEELQDSNKTFNIIYEMWTKYHLNDMKPDCEHQRANIEFQKQKNKKIICYKWLHLKKEMSEEKKEIENFIRQSLNDTGEVKLNERQKALYQLKDCLYNHVGAYDTNNYYHDNKDIFYKTCNWITEKEHKEGILLKPCPICGYKYGSSWLYMPIESNDLKIINKLMEA